MLKLNIPVAGSAATSRASRVDTNEIVLPTEMTEPSQSLSDYILFIYGEKKIGKTSLASNFPNPLHLFFEPGGKGLKTYSIEISHWEQFQKVVQLLGSRQGERYDTVVIDTADMEYEKCFDWVCYDQGFEHPNDMNDFGKSWKKISAEFTKQLMQIVQGCHKGLVILSHAKEAEFTTKYHGVWNKTVPTLSGSAVSWVTGVADLNGCYGYYRNPVTNKRARRLLIEGDAEIEGGARMKKYNFRTTDGQPVISIPMGASDEEAYANLLDAFHNKQEDDGVYVLEWDAELTDRSAAAKRKGK